ncbi:hypothetical protein VCUG_02231 [Vavraia culicis subsp. floridensis]|uniref:Uncharacterized protein n=1 Tax=Vavraia culicis (isolate floridensis) TaxID=948595 RepID=L2GRK0_VAVCU|nr:uncharacterized protein VCUG_02231 [Vavraia culicis subsp. floridensis]ELA46264.1 hypothetical protein VCUG_02231 [Vavraia culicis subsp. floridensis]
MMSIKNKLKSTCEHFLADIHSFRMPIKNETTLTKILLATHITFTKLMNQIDIYNRHIHVKTIKLQKKQEDEQFVLYEYNNRDVTFTVLVHNEHGIVQIETGLIELNYKAMNYVNKLEIKDQLEQIELFLSLYADFKWRCCDFCLEYTIFPDFSFPIGRALEKDFVAAFHLECNEKNDEKHKVI